jgi:hypothetical protein
MHFLGRDFGWGGQSGDYSRMMKKYTANDFKFFQLPVLFKYI